MSNWLVGLIALVVIGVGTFLGFTKDIQFLNEPYEIKAAFRDGSGLNAGSPVRVAGVDVGEVTEVEHTEPGSQSITATMTIRDNGRPIAEDARAAIRPRIFLEGNFFVDLSPGTPQARELDEGEAIPTSRTSNPVQFGEVLKLLKRDTRQDLKQTLGNLADAQEAGAGRAFNRTLEFQAPAFKYSAIVNDALLGQRPGDLARWIRSQGIVSAALDRNPRNLQSLITDFNATAAALADREADLRRAIRVLPDTLEVAMPTFAALNDAFPEVRRFSAATIPAVRSSTPAINATVPLLRQLRGLVGEDELQGLAADLRRAIPPATRLAEETVPVLEQARTLAGCTNNVLVPFGNDRVPDENFPATGPVHEELSKPFPALAGESRSFDANGQWFKVLGTGGAETFDFGDNLFGTTATPIVGVNPPPDRTRPPLRPDVPCETQQRPNLDTEQAPGPRKVENPQRSKAAQERLAKARTLAIAVLNAQLKQSGDDRVIRDEEITPGEIQQLLKQKGVGR
jgi:phospholipid/cholesterol/gamma-HCH transport system substrate-binding protein